MSMPKLQQKSPSPNEAVFRGRGSSMTLQNTGEVMTTERCNCLFSRAVLILKRKKKRKGKVEPKSKAPVGKIFPALPAIWKQNLLEIPKTSKKNS